MAIFFPPPPQFVGGAQPYDNKNLSANFEAVTVNDPPPSNRGRLALTLSAILLAWQPPLPDAFMGNRQPLARRTLPASLEAVAVNNPPFSPNYNNPRLTTVLAQWAAPLPMSQRGPNLVPIAIGAFSGTVADTAASSDATTGAMTVVVSLSDSNASSDATTGAMTVAASLSDSNASSDATTGAMTVVVSLSDSNASSDAATGAMTVASSLSDSASSSDATTGTGTAVAAPSDSVASSDATSAAMTVASALTDSVSSSDAWVGSLGSGIFTFNWTDTVAVTSDTWFLPVPVNPSVPKLQVGTIPDYDRPPLPIIPGGAEAYMLRETGEMAAIIQELILMCPQSATAAPIRLKDGMKRLARNPWWPVSGQTRDEWVYYDGAAGIWRYSITEPTTT